mgnify:FL=1
MCPSGHPIIISSRNLICEGSRGTEVVSVVIVDWRGDRGAPECLSAHHRGIVVTIVAVNVEISHLSTIGDQVVDRVDSISLDNSGERGHLTLSTRMPDHTLDEPLSRGGAGVEINLSGRILELHGVPCFDSLNIHGLGVLCHHSGQLEECHTNGGPMTQPTILFLIPLVTGVTL